MSPEIPGRKAPELNLEGQPARPAKVFVTRTLGEGELPTWGDIKDADSVLAEVQAQASRLNPPATESGVTNA